MERKCINLCSHLQLLKRSRGEEVPLNFISWLQFGQEFFLQPATQLTPIYIVHQGLLILFKENFKEAQVAIERLPNCSQKVS